ncbi:MAG TPA: 2-C-methyl-D-erythritol 4-phosphate cytidylyltransferase [Candidatus Latescibacteria bacterium]|nr:2-C-methyl-D-erythritol 4-phosphate cytidylyltransferase [Candidatus Latescibacterota bacterium]
MSEVTAIIAAAGAGRRMGPGPPKQLLELGGRPILIHTLQAFEQCEQVDDIIVVVSREIYDFCTERIPPHFPKVKRIVTGGERRQDSVYEGLKAVEDGTKIVVIHDGTRPFITPQEISESIRLCRQAKAVVVAVRVKDTIKSVVNGAVKETLDRNRLWAAQTPQTFEFPLILRAYQEAYGEGFYSTDDSALVERLGYKVEVLEGSYRNIKITTPEDLILAKRILRNFT